MRPEQLVDLARERGLDGICLTEHDRAWPEAEIEALRQATGFVVLSGVELTTNAGHILAFGLRLDLPLPTAAAVAAAAREQGALLYLAHPARDGLLRVNHDTVSWFASVEAVNGSDTRLQNLAATGLARGFRLPGIGGSDAHAPAEVGRAATRFHDDITSEVDLLAALRSGRYEAVQLE